MSVESFIRTSKSLDFTASDLLELELELTGLDRRDTEPNRRAGCARCITRKLRRLE
ncbi:MAG: hypothetical protein OXC80_01560 [Gammaproteobacteria bacterium]|nr:hypothetical protein [Gammaproteobacteria bacterium]